MANSSILQGLSILIVEDEPLIAMDISQAFEALGAHLTITNTLRHAMLLIEHDGLSAAILDHALGDGETSSLYARLHARGIPYMIYSGYGKRTNTPGHIPHVDKPATHEQLTAAMEDLIRSNPRPLGLRDQRS
jgi:DNA-binding NtrC family response regulator